MHVAFYSRGDAIAFTKQGGGRFAIGIMKPDGSGERILTEGYHNEGPTFAPNGRVLMFFRDPGANAGGPSLYTVDITGRNVQVRVTRTAGDLIINGWIDAPANQFWSGRVTNREVRLPIDVEKFLREYPARRCRGQTGSAATACIGAAQRVAPAAAEVLIQEEFQRFLRTAPAAPAPDLAPSIANPRFGGSGEHKVYFEVVPVQPDVNGVWAARLEIWLVDAHGNEANVFTYDVDNRRYPGHRLEHPLKPIVATLVVRAAAEK